MLCESFTFRYPHVVLFLMSFAVASLLIPVLANAARRFGAVDRPHTYKTHKTPIPFVGGIGVFIAFALILLTSITIAFPIHSIQDFIDSHRDPNVRSFFGMIVGGFIVLVLGIVDDFRPINAMLKLAILVIACLILTQMGVKISIFGEYDWLNHAFTLFWISGVISALNSFDNTDGATGGVAFISLLATFAIAWGKSAEEAQPWLSFVAVTLAGALLGFLQSNFPPASVYLGDGGAFSLGFILGATSVFGQWSEHWYRAIVIPILLVGLPIYDIVICTAFRYVDKTVSSFYQAVVYCGRDHVAHRIMALGFSKVKAVMVMYLIQMILCASAVFLVQFDDSLSDVAFFSIVFVVAVAFFILTLILHRAPLKDNVGTDGSRPMLPLDDGARDA
ncbi:MAG: undecaprenyl/decaprenyl-phosphate alpha-N-acetylglucosaminyl 1-phosphate transferase [Planctomycetes bacterium]|nr:undecaprenyl/decaprenyl-phosphate alpha-N-acetylglucosaminyl 1-phosphate transferase [Planctomycetota bacterium]